MRISTFFNIKQIKVVRIIAFPFVNFLRIERLVFYRFTKNSKKVRKLKSSHKNERCFIIGNGPSLCCSDLELIKNEYSFAANRIFEIFCKTEWRPSAYLCMDSYVIKEHKEEIKRLEIKNTFFELEGRKYIKTQATYLNNFCPYYVNRYKRLTVKFSDNPSHYIVAGETVTYTAIQLAVYMGFKEIYLLGVDHNYSKKMNSKGQLMIDSTVQDYFGNLQTRNYVIQNYETSTNAYCTAKKYCEQHGIIIKNLTRGGLLEVFERDQLENILKNER